MWSAMALSGRSGLAPAALGETRPGLDPGPRSTGVPRRSGSRVKPGTRVTRGRGAQHQRPQQPICGRPGLAPADLGETRPGLDPGPRPTGVPRRSRSRVKPGTRVTWGRGAQHQRPQQPICGRPGLAPADLGETRPGRDPGLRSTPSAKPIEVPGQARGAGAFGSGRAPLRAMCDPSARALDRPLRGRPLPDPIRALVRGARWVRAAPDCVGGGLPF